MLDRLRRYVSRFIVPVAKIFLSLGFSPNLVSVLGLLFAFLASYLLFLGRSSLAALFILVSGFFDVLDGAVARVGGLVSGFGGFFDSVLDRLSDASLFFALIYFHLCGLGWGLLALIGSLLVSYVRAKGELLGVRLAGVGVAERSERLLILSFGLFFGLVDWAVMLIVFLTFLTVFIRSLFVWRALR